MDQEELYFLFFLSNQWKIEYFFSVTDKKALKNYIIKKIFKKLEKTSEIETVILRVNCDDQGKIKVKNLLKKVFEFDLIENNIW